MNATVDVKINFFPLAWYLYFVEPIIEIDGEMHKKEWGKHRFELTPGKHLVRIYFSYMGKPECGLNQIEVQVKSGETKRISYYMPPFLFSKGRIKMV